MRDLWKTKYKDEEGNWRKLKWQTRDELSEKVEAWYEGSSVASRWSKSCLVGIACIRARCALPESPGELHLFLNVTGSNGPLFVHYTQNFSPVQFQCTFQLSKHKAILLSKWSDLLHNSLLHSTLFLQLCHWIEVMLLKRTSRITGFGFQKMAEKEERVLVLRKIPCKRLQFGKSVVLELQLEKTAMPTPKCEKGSL